MSKLLIVESPAKAKTISKYLNGEYQVIASIGHIRDLPKSNKKAIDIEAGFVPHYEISKGKEKIVSEIKHLADKASEVLLATDPDREGEAIAWHIAEATGLKHPKRVVFYEITKEAVQEAIKEPRNIDDNLKQAQEARRVLDRLVGYDLSGLIWKKVRYGLSAGRVQSPALRIIMEREREIRAFKSHSFWIISADVFSPRSPRQRLGEIFTVVCEEEPIDKKEVDRIISIVGGMNDREEKNTEITKSKWYVKDVKETNVKKSPRAPYITSTLQQSASSRFGFAPSRTMRIAQKLYEAGLITYMRTDSTNLSGIAIAQIVKIVEKKFGKEYLQVRTFTAKSKNAQEAHEAIRPTHFDVESAGHTDEQKKLYQLIWRRAVSSQMKDAMTLRTKVTANVEYGDPIRDGNTLRALAVSNGTRIPDFSVTGSQIKFPGWLLGDPASRGDDIELPKVSIGESLDLKRIWTEEKQTEPPGRYSEAGLIKELEKRGIGRPSTYASIIKTLQDRGYVEKVNKALMPTDTGDVVSSFLEANFADYISDSFTAEMEDKLDLIADGKEEYVKILKNFYKPFLKDVKSKDKMDKVTNLGDADPKFKCPVCGSPMIIKLSRSGKFLSCAKYPDCEGALTMEGVEIKKDEPIGIDPESGLPIFVMVGKYGPYVQLGERIKGKGSKKAMKPKMASVPRGKNLENITLDDAIMYLTLPRALGKHPDTGEMITANNGRFGPYVVHQKDFRSLKPARNATHSVAGGEDDVYKIELPRALEIFAQEKKKRGFARKKKTE